MIYAATNAGLYRLDASTDTGRAGESRLEPKGFVLLQNTPNPFNPSTVIGFELASPMQVGLAVYSVSGQKVRQLASGQVISAGQHTFTWDGRDDAGTPVSSGVYLYRLEAGETVQTKRMLLIK